MRFTTFIASALCIVELAFAQPHGRRHYHLSSVNKRGAVAIAQPNPVVEPTPAVVTVTVTHYVQETRVPVKRDSPAEAPTPAPLMRKAVNININSNINTNVNSNTGDNEPRRVVGSSSSFSSSFSSGEASEAVHENSFNARAIAPEPIGSKGGIVWTPYSNSGGCKSEGEFRSELGSLRAYGLVRIYGTDCNQVDWTLKYFPGKVFLGVFNMANLNGELNTLIKGVGNRWNRVHTVSVGNELVNMGAASPAVMNQKTNEARSTLRSAGYKGPVVTVDTFIAVRNNPALCQASDYIAINCHPFFDPNTPASNAGAFIKQQIAEVKKVCGANKQIVVTETGWPKKGNPNGKAIPSESAHLAAIRSIRSALGSQSILLTARDELWKKDNPSTFNAERFWGVLEL